MKEKKNIISKKLHEEWQHKNGVEILTKLITLSEVTK